MKQQLSSLMDGELDVAQGNAALSVLANDAGLRDCWGAYHLIGDCLRRVVTTDMAANAALYSASAARIMARLADEPTILAPRRKPAAGAIGGKTRMALAMAASVATLAVIGLIASRQVQETPVQVAQQPAQAATPANNVGITPGVNDYLVLHRQFANPEAILPANLVRDGKVQRQGAGR